MLSYSDIAKHFGSSLFDKNFQSFLSDTFKDLNEYNVTSNYLVSNSGIELGFKNDEAIWDEDDNTVFDNGKPLFSHFNLFPKSTNLIHSFPFNTTFNDNRNAVIKKAGSPFQTKEGYLTQLNKKFLVDNYKVSNLIITFDYEPETETINFIQIRDYTLYVI